MYEQEPSIDLIIPTYQPDKKFDQLMKNIQKQTIQPNHIFIINTVVENNRQTIQEKYGNIPNLSIINIEKEAFDHGGTRNYGASLSDENFIMFMTQDAVPADKYLIENMLSAFTDKKIAAAYGRQLADKCAGEIEKYTRNFNYPNEDLVKAEADLKRIGIKTYFCSNVCAMYKKEIYEELGGFVTKTIFNEDMIMASKVIKAGYSIAYASKARVIHSHTYSYRTQFTRNFDLAVSQCQYKEIFGGIKSETEGIELVKQTIKYLIVKKKAYLIPDLIFQSGFKYLGYKAGYHYQSIPKALVRKLSMNKSYWK
jgi:rhamnosyltransferase